VKFQDPAAPYSTVVAPRRASRAVTDGELFRLGRDVSPYPQPGLGRLR
jgi:hypothetical protein